MAYAKQALNPDAAEPDDEFAKLGGSANDPLTEALRNAFRTVLGRADAAAAATGADPYDQLGGRAQDRLSVAVRESMRKVLGPLDRTAGGSSGIEQQVAFRRSMTPLGGGEPVGKASGPAMLFEERGNAPIDEPTEVAGGFAAGDMGTTVQDFVSANCRAGIYSVLPRQFLGMTIGQVLSIAQSGDAAARSCIKLLGQDRFRK